MGDAFAFSFEIMEEIKTELESTLKKVGPTSVLDSMQGSLDKWKESTLNIGVTGKSGVGKSTLINTIRGLTGECPGAAHTGATETTREAKAYAHPDNKNLVFWDLPGIGTENFPRETYFKDERVQFDRYDMFLILSSERFYQDDSLLAKEAKAIHKVCTFIRTKVDNDVESERRQKPSTFKNDPNATDKLLGQIRDEVVKGLKDDSLSIENSLFLIDCIDLNTYDFGKLIKRLIDGFAGLKRESFILALNVLSSDVLEQKVDVLRKRIWRVSLISATVAAVPVPGASMCIDTALILKESLFYMKQLGITKADIQKASEMFSTNVEEFTAKVDIKTAVLSWTVQDMSAKTTLIAISEAAENIVKVIIPIIGCALSSATSFTCTYSILNKTLNMMAADARKLQSYMLKHVEKRVAFDT